MGKLESLAPERVFKYFEEICAIPHGSTNMDAISAYCMDFAKAHSLKAVRDVANNVIIYKNGTPGYENADTVILQGHLDMVCQKTEDSDIDFEKDGLDVYIDGDFVKAKGTTLGADNGIAVAMILAILESDTIAHPPIEALFTTDEEIGMIGAMQVDTAQLRGKKMINLDAEEDWAVTVSCAGGSDCVITVPKSEEKASGRLVEIALKGLRGGHSGVEINGGRVNASILAGRVLNYLKKNSEYRLISINGGNKGNAITNACTVQLVTSDNDFEKKANGYFDIIAKEISEREPDFAPAVKAVGGGEYDVMDSSAQSKVEFMLLCAPNGVMEMSAEIEGLVETSLNLGILKTEADSVTMHFTLRSNKQSAMKFLEDKMISLAEYVGCETRVFGHYPPWEFNEKSVMQKIYKEAFEESFGCEPEVAAIHAGLECGTFAAKIPDLDCISIGPTLAEVHTVNERMSISSVKKIYGLLLKIMEKCR